jgi:hypothetical protein
MCSLNDEDDDYDNAIDQIQELSYGRALFFSSEV